MDNDKYTQQQEIEDFFAQFDRISDRFESSVSGNSFEAPRASEKPEEPEMNVSASRRQRQDEAKKSKTGFDKARQGVLDFADGFISRIKGFFAGKEDLESEASEDSDMSETTKKHSARSSKRKYRFNWKRFIKTAFIVCVALGIAGCAYAGVVIAKCTPIDPDNIYSMLSESSVLYDSDGNVISTVGMTAENRTIIEYGELPENLVNAFISIEDKTFWEHHGFNFIRIFGAIRDSIFSGGRIGGTSTITQQLARNVYLTDTMSSRSLTRKITEAYYSVQLEKTLSKEQIIEAYLNTINLGFGAHGVQAAAQAYFSKDVEELDLLECASLAALPKSPSAFALIKRLEKEDVDPDSSIIIYEASDYTYVYNGDKSAKRRMQTLKNMYDQGMITAEEREAAESQQLVDHMNPNMSSLTEISTYFTDYVTSTVINDLMNSNNMKYEDAYELVYNGGLQIYTTMDTRIQKILEQEYANSANFPSVAHLSKDGNGNLLNVNGRVLLLAKGNIIADDGNFYLRSGEYEWLPSGDLKLTKGNRLNFYKTVVGGAEDVSIEFKNMYYIDGNGKFYSIAGGTILVPQGYKHKDNDGNCIIDADFFTDGQEYFKQAPDGTWFVDSKHYALKQDVIQPQSAMVITDFTTGNVKAMVGGRNTSGRLLFNRATATRQPGSSIKPICVYGAALQKSVDALNGGTTPDLTSYNNGHVEANLFGKYMTAASVIDDSPLIVNGKQWPKNWYAGFRGLYTLRTAVEQSVNVCAVKVFQTVGPEYAADYAAKFGISTIVKSGESNDMNAAALALGGMTNGAKPIEMASAYGTYANGGLYMSPLVYTKVTDKRGEVLIEAPSYSRQACDPGVAFIMTDILRSTVSNGIASGAGFGGQPVAGKTGTTTDNYDAWFVGLTPQYAAACWIGNDVNIELSQGSAAAAKLWSKVMSQVCAGIPTGSYKSQPENVISVAIDTKSGLLPTAESTYDYRGTVRNEYFISGTQPTEYDNVHTYVLVCNDSGYLATPSCSNTSWKFGVKRPYLVNPAVGDIDYEVPHYYCPYHNPDPSKYPTSGSGLDPTGAYTPTKSDTTTQQPDDTPAEGLKPGEGSGNGGGSTTPSPDPGQTQPSNPAPGVSTDPQVTPPEDSIPDWLN